MRTVPDVTIRSFVAVGDSFTEGLNDVLGDGPGGTVTFGGWADRLALRLATHAGASGFRYANLAIRGRLLDAIVAEQVPVALAAAPDLISFSAGGNDVLRPGFDPDDAAARFERAVERLGSGGARVVMFTGFDTRATPVLRLARGRIAIYNEHLHGVAARQGCDLVDLWSFTPLYDRRAFSDDRLHLTPEGHERVARLVARTIGLDGPDPYEPWPAVAVAARTRREDLMWARTHLVPWVARHVRGRSSGDGLAPKRPSLQVLEAGASRLDRGGQQQP